MIFFIEAIVWKQALALVLGTWIGRVMLKVDQWGFLYAVI